MQQWQSEGSSSQGQLAQCAALRSVCAAVYVAAAVLAQHVHSIASAAVRLQHCEGMPVHMCCVCCACECVCVCVLCARICISGCPVCVSV